MNPIVRTALMPHVRRLTHFEEAGGHMLDPRTGVVMHDGSVDLVPLDISSVNVDALLEKHPLALVFTECGYDWYAYDPTTKRLFTIGHGHDIMRARGLLEDILT